MSSNWAIMWRKHPKKNCGAKNEGDHSTVTRWFKTFCMDCKNLDNQAKSSRPKSMDSEAELHAIEANLVSCTWRVSGKLSISQSSVVHHIHNLGKSIQNCQIVPQNIAKLFTHPSIIFLSNLS